MSAPDGCVPERDKIRCHTDTLRGLRNIIIAANLWLSRAWAARCQESRGRASAQHLPSHPAALLGLHPASRATPLRLEAFLSRLRLPAVHSLVSEVVASLALLLFFLSSLSSIYHLCLTLQTRFHTHKWLRTYTKHRAIGKKGTGSYEMLTPKSFIISSRSSSSWSLYFSFIFFILLCRRNKSSGLSVKHKDFWKH